MKRASYLAGAVAAATMLSAAAAPAASAAITSGGQQFSPDTSVLSCGSHSVWLRLWGSLSETCYTGDGAIVVNLPGVYQEQIVGLHTVCLYAADELKIWCTTGPGEFRITPPVQVSGITIRTP
jgi:hypothetical protein